MNRGGDNSEEEVASELCSAGDDAEDAAICTCGGQAVIEHVQKVLDYLAVTELQEPNHYTALRDLLIYSYEHMSHVTKRQYLIDEICDELSQADYLLSNHPAWQRYQLLKYVYQPSFLAGERLAYPSQHHPAGFGPDTEGKSDVAGHAADDANAV